MDARILIVDDHEIVREGVRGLIARFRPEWIICGDTARMNVVVSSSVASGWMRRITYAAAYLNSGFNTCGASLVPAAIEL